MKKSKLSPKGHTSKERRIVSRIVLSDEEPLCESRKCPQAKAESVVDLRGSKEAPIELDIDHAPASTLETGIDLTFSDDEAAGLASAKNINETNETNLPNIDQEDDEKNGIVEHLSSEKMRYWCRKRRQIQDSIGGVHDHIRILRSLRDRYVVKQTALREKHPKTFTGMLQFKINKNKLVGNTGHLQGASLVLEERKEMLKAINDKIEELVRAGGSGDI